MIVRPRDPHREIGSIYLAGRGCEFLAVAGFCVGVMLAMFWGVPGLHIVAAIFAALFWAFGALLRGVAGIWAVLIQERADNARARQLGKFMGPIPSGEIPMPLDTKTAQAVQGLRARAAEGASTAAAAEALRERAAKSKRPTGTLAGRTQLGK